MEKPLRFDLRSAAPPLTWSTRPPERRWWNRVPKRVWLALYVVLLVFALVWIGYQAGQGHFPWMLLFWAPVSVVMARSQQKATEVTSSQVRVIGTFRETLVPVAEIAEVEDPGRWGTEVKLRRRNGEPIVLPYVQPADVPAIRERLGAA